MVGMGENQREKIREIEKEKSGERSGRRKVNVYTYIDVCIVIMYIACGA